MKIGERDWRYGSFVVTMLCNKVGRPAAKSWGRLLPIYTVLAKMNLLAHLQVDVIGEMERRDGGIVEFKCLGEISVSADDLIGLIACPECRATMGNTIRGVGISWGYTSIVRAGSISGAVVDSIDGCRCTPFVPDVEGKRPDAVFGAYEFIDSCCDMVVAAGKQFDIIPGGRD